MQTRSHIPPQHSKWARKGGSDRTITQSFNKCIHIQEAKGGPKWQKFAVAGSPVIYTTMALHDGQAA